MEAQTIFERLLVVRARSVAHDPRYAVVAGNLVNNPEERMRAALLVAYVIGVSHPDAETSVLLACIGARRHVAADAYKLRNIVAYAGDAVLRVFEFLALQTAGTVPRTAFLRGDESVPAPETIDSFGDDGLGDVTDAIDLGDSAMVIDLETPGAGGAEPFIIDLDSLPKKPAREITESSLQFIYDRTVANARRVVKDFEDQVSRTIGPEAFATLEGTLISLAEEAAARVAGDWLESVSAVDIRSLPFDELGHIEEKLKVDTARAFLPTLNETIRGYLKTRKIDNLFTSEELAARGDEQPAKDRETRLVSEPHNVFATTRVSFGN